MCKRCVQVRHVYESVCVMSVGDTAIENFPILLFYATTETTNTTGTNAYLWFALARWSSTLPTLESQQLTEFLHFGQSKQRSIPVA